MTCIILDTGVHLFCYQFGRCKSSGSAVPGSGAGVALRNDVALIIDQNQEHAKLTVPSRFIRRGEGSWLENNLPWLFLWWWCWQAWRLRKGMEP
jgi:hypothetical protein